MIIWGWRGVTSTKEKGQFHCPGCACKRAYRHQMVRNWFTLYFIPVIPLAKMGDYVECTRCRDTYKTAVLDYDPEAAQEAFLSEYQHACLAVMAAVLVADGEVERSELETAQSIFEELSGRRLAMETLQQVVRKVDGSDGEIIDRIADLAPNLNDEGRENVVRAAFLVAAADGEFQQEEKVLIGKLGKALGMSRHHLNGVVNELIEQRTTQSATA